MDPRHSYQTRAMQWCCDHEAGLLDIDMGLGKTRIMVDFINENNLKALVVAPIRVMQLTWPEEVMKWAPNLTFSVLHGRDKNYFYDGNADIKVVNFEGLKWLYGRWTKNQLPLHNRVLIIDESARIRNVKGMTFKILREMVHAFKRRYLLSATPCPNGYIGLWAQYYMIDKGEALGRNFYAFKNNYFIDHGAPSYRITPRGADALKDIRDKVTHLTFRLDANDHLKMPSLTNVVREATLPVDAANLYVKMHEDSVIEIGGEQIAATSEGAQLMKLRQIIQGGLYHDNGYYPIHEAKVDALEGLVEEANGNPLLVAIQFKFEVDMLTKRFGPLPLMAGGCKDPQAILAKWNQGDIPVLLCHPASVGHGLNMQKGGHHLVWYSLTWDWEQYHQLAGRLHRQGQTRPVVVTHIVIRGTLDEVICRSLRAKGSSQRTFNDSIRAAMLAGRRTVARTLGVRGLSQAQ